MGKATLFTSVMVCMLILSVLFATPPAFIHAALAPTAASIPPMGDAAGSGGLSSFALPLPAFLPDRIERAGPDTWKTYVDASRGLALKYPPNWQASSAKESRADSTVLFHGPEGDVYLRVYASALAPVPKGQPATAVTIAGLPARRISIPGGQNPPQDIVTFERDGNQFELQFVHATDSLSLFEQMLDSIEFPTVLPQPSAPLAPQRLAWDPCSTAGGGWSSYICYSSLPSTGWCTRLASIDDAGFASIGVYSNGNNGMNGCMDTYNLKFQCVELAQRYYAIRYGMDPIWRVGGACHMWNQYPDKLESRPNNGTSPPPVRGDLIIFGCPDGGNGHVAVAAASPSGGRIYFYQQNASTAYTYRPFSGGKIQDSRVVGWMHWIGDGAYYVLNVGVTGSGSVSKSPDQSQYKYGDVVKLTATPASGWLFSGWSGALSGLVNPQSITMTGDKSVTAGFEVVRSLTGVSFTFTPSGPKQNSPVTFTRVITPTNATLPITYTWSFGDGSGRVTTRSSSVSHTFGSIGTYTVWLTATNGYSAPVVYHRRVTVTGYVLNVGVTGSGSVSKSPDQGQYKYGDVVKLTAMPASDWLFSGWSGALSGRVNPQFITMTGDKSVTAGFEAIRLLAGVSFTFTPSGPKQNSPVTFTRVITPTNATLPITYTWSFGDGSARVTTRSSSVSHTFGVTGTYTVWLTATNGYGAPVVYHRRVTVTGYVLNVGITGSGKVSKDPDQAEYVYGDVVKLTAMPAADWLFSGWGGALSGLVNPRFITVTGNKSVTAGFEVIWPLTGVSFTFTPPNPKEDYTVTFTRVVTPTNATLPITYTWSFGDGSARVTTRSPSVSHAFDLGTYTVWLTATNGYRALVVNHRKITVTKWEYRHYLPVVRRQSR